MIEPLRDVVVIGAGPAGSALAAFLAREGLDTLLVDKSAFPRDKTCGDGLTPRALGVADKMGLLEQILEAGFVIHGVRFTAPGGVEVELPIPAWDGLPAYSAVVPRVKLDDIFLRHAARAGAQVETGAEAVEVLGDGTGGSRVRLETADGPSEIRARFAVLATGASMGLLRRSGMLPAAPAFGRAARAYVEGLEGLSDAIEFHLEAVPLPGYGWVFPTSPTTANVGAGTVGGSAAATAPASPRAVYDGFVSSPDMARRLKSARMLSPVKGYPLRVDFPTARLAEAGRGVVGEAAGLVNPLTGEGIDYALELAETVAEVLAEGLRRGAPADQLAWGYATRLRDRFQRTFLAVQRMRDLYLRPWVLDRAARVAVKHEDYRTALVHVCMGNLSPRSMFGARMLFRLAAG